MSLLSAIENQQLDDVTNLLREGADPNKAEKFEPYTAPIRPLELAMSVAGDCVGSRAINLQISEIILLLLRAGAHADDCNLQKTSNLSMAIKDRTHREVILMLLAAGANPNLRDDTGMSPFHWAVHSRDLSLIELLLRAGALQDLNEISGVELGHGSPLNWAALKLDVALVELLLKWGADPDRDVDRKNAFESMPERTSTNADSWDKIRGLLEKKSKEIKKM